MSGRKEPLMIFSNWSHEEAEKVIFYNILIFNILFFMA